MTYIRLCQNVWRRQTVGRVCWSGEWGGFGRAGSMDRAWQERLATFLVERGLSDNFFWCLNPNSGDTVRTAQDIAFLH